MFPTGAEMKASYYNAITSKLNELIESDAKFGNMYTDVTGPIQYIGPDVEAILVDHGYEVKRYTDRYSITHNVIYWNNNIEVDDIHNSKLITSTKLRKSRMKELILQSISSDFRQYCMGTVNNIIVGKLCLDEYLYRNRNNPIVQDCINTVCTYGYSYDEKTNRLIPI